MSYDVFFWVPADDVSAEDALEAAADGDTSRLRHADEILAFRRELVDRYPDAVDYIEPLDDDPEDDFDKYVLVTIPMASAGLATEFIEIAERHKVSHYDPQLD